MTLRKNSKMASMRLKLCNKILVSADKARKLYKLEKEQYQKLLKENISKT